MQGEGCMKMEVELGVMQTQAKECLELQEAGEAGRILPGAPGEQGPCPHLDFELLATRTVRD